MTGLRLRPELAATHLRTDCKSSQFVYVGLQQVLASSKLGVADVLARLLGLLPADPEVLCFVVLRGIASPKDIMCAQSSEFAEFSLS